MKSSLSEPGKKAKMPPGDAGMGDKSLSWAGKKNIDSDATRSSTPTLTAPGSRVA